MDAWQYSPQVSQKSKQAAKLSKLSLEEEDASPLLSSVEIAPLSPKEQQWTSLRPPLPSAVPNSPGSPRAADYDASPLSLSALSQTDPSRGLSRLAAANNLSPGPSESYSARMKRTGGVINSQSSVHRPPPQQSMLTPGSGRSGGGGGNKHGPGRIVLNDSELELMKSFRQQRHKRQTELSAGPLDPFVAAKHLELGGASVAVGRAPECCPTSLRAMLDGFEEWEAEMASATAALNARHRS